jgi:hypothetical protein
MTRTEIIQYRQAVASDVQFIIRTWIDSFKGSHGAGILSIHELAVPCSCGKPIRYDFGAVMEVTLANLLQRPGLTTWVAHNPRERPPHDLYGYLVSETEPNVPTYVRGADGESVLKVETSPEPLVHFVFVKRIYREMGIARALFHRAGIDPRAPYLYTCKTPNVSKLEKAGVMPNARWFPLSARFTRREKTK